MKGIFLLKEEGRKMFSEVLKQTEFFKRHRNELVRKHHGKYVVICNEKVVVVRASEAHAYADAVRDHKLEPGQFSVHRCIPEDEDLPAVFHSRVT